MWLMKHETAEEKVERDYEKALEAFMRATGYAKHDAANILGELDHLGWKLEPK